MSDLRERIRIALVDEVEALRATFTEYPLEVEYANGKVVNTATQTKPYLKVRIVYQDGDQINLALDPDYRAIGSIVVEAAVKAGSGTAEANRLLEHFYPTLQLSDRMGPLRTRAARFASKDARDGWAAEAALIPFWADSIS